MIDVWGEVLATITLDEEKLTDEALLGLDAFSHVEVLTLFHLVSPNSVHVGARQQRVRQD